MNTVNIIIFHNLPHAVYNQLARRGAAGIVINAAIPCERAVIAAGQPFFRLVVRRHGLVVEPYPIGIDPRLNTQTAFMRERNHQFQRVVTGVAPLLTCQITGPGEIFGLIKRVAKRPRVDKYRIESKVGRLVKRVPDVLYKLRLCFSLDHRLKRQIGDPHAAHLAVNRRGKHRGMRAAERLPVAAVGRFNAVYARVLRTVQRNRRFFPAGRRARGNLAAASHSQHQHR